jgi:hypothetical protein
MNSYSELSAAVTAFAGQEGNPEFTNQVGLFISLGEDQVYRSLRHDRMIKSAALSGSPPFLIPDDFLEMSAVNHGYDLCEYAPPELVLSAPASTDPPTLWSILGSELVFDGTPTAETVISYFAKLPNLVNEPNALFLLNSDLFLYATLTQAMIFLRDEAREGAWDGLFKRKLDEINAASWHARLPKQQPLKMRYS